MSCPNTTDYVRGLCVYGGLANDGQGKLVQFATVSGSNSNAYVTSSSNQESTAEVSFGKLTFGVTDLKTAMALDIQFDATGTASISPWVEADGVRVSYGPYTSTSTPAFVLPIEATTARELEVGCVFTRGATTTSQITLKRMTLRAFIKANRTREFILPLIIAPRIRDLQGVEHTIDDTRTEIDTIAAMVGQVVVLQVGTKSEYVQIKDYVWQPKIIDSETAMMSGVCNVKCQVVV
jgi:hypothetical protein